VEEDKGTCWYGPPCKNRGQTEKNEKNEKNEMYGEERGRTGGG
jgi:hypothetical protein